MGLVDFGNTEVFGIGVGKIPATDGSGREHGIGTGKGHVDIFFYIEQVPQFFFFAVFGAAGVSGGGANAIELLLNELVVIKSFGAVAPEFGAKFEVHELGKGFG